MLIILDGWGINPRRKGNAVALARTPVLDKLFAAYPHCTLLAHGEAVGLTAGQMGNSNVGHLNMGAGRVVYQDLLRIDRAIASGEFESNPVVRAALEAGGRPGATLHLMGLVSDGGVHSHLRHLFALLKLAARSGLERVFIHCFLDGRDVPPASALEYLAELENLICSLGVGKVATVMGRYYGMDRDKRWDRTRKAYEAMVERRGLVAPDALTAVREAYDRGETDEFVQPTVIDLPGGDVASDGALGPGDSLFFFNFRADRARQITRALADPGFTDFPRAEFPRLGYVGTMARYDEEFNLPYAFGPLVLKNTFGEWISAHGLRQLRIAETEKYAHVTFFFNGGEERVMPGEDRILIPSPKVPTYDLVPEMSAFEVTAAVIDAMERDAYDVIVLNYANLDMVGHTGVLEAAIVAVEAVDECLGRVLAALREAGGAALLLSDHGNAEEMIDARTGEPQTAHSANPVPCLLVDDRRQGVSLRDGILADVAPTLLELLGLPVPPEMTGRSLIVGA